MVATQCERERERKKNICILISVLYSDGVLCNAVMSSRERERESITTRDTEVSICKCNVTLGNVKYTVLCNP